MSMYLPECNVSLTGTTAAVRLTVPTTGLLKAGTTGCVTAVWIKIPEEGFDTVQNSNRAILSRAGGLTGGGDGFLNMPMAGTSINWRWRNSGSDQVNGSSGLTVSGLTPGKTYLVLAIQTALNAHLVACESGGTPIVASVVSSSLYTLNVTANFWDAVGGGTGATARGLYGPVEEFCFWTGLFPETGGVSPDTTTIQNLANGTTDLSTFHTTLSGAKKCRYRMITADDKSDNFGLLADLAPQSTGSDKILRSSGPLRPIALAPAFSCTQISQLVLPTPGSTTGATAVINTPAGTYSGISPVAIQAQLLKEDRSVLTTWETVATPSAGSWAEGRFAAAQPYTAGRLECQFKAIDGGGAQLGDIVSAFGQMGTGFNFISESQSQLLVLFDNVGAGSIVVPAGIRLQTTHFPNGATLPSSKDIGPDNVAGRLGRGIKKAAIEINGLYPGAPISFSAVGVVGTPIDDYLTGGAHVANWANLKARLGVNQPYYLLLFGHITLGTANTAPLYATAIAAVRTICETNFGTAMKQILCPSARYAGITGTTGLFAAAQLVRTAMRDFVIANPASAVLGGSFQTIKNDMGDATTDSPTFINPHPNPDLNVGHGRSGSYAGYALLMACRAVKQQPLQIKSVTPSGVTLRLKMGPVNTL